MQEQYARDGGLAMMYKDHAMPIFEGTKHLVTPVGPSQELRTGRWEVDHSRFESFSQL